MSAPTLVVDRPTVVFDLGGVLVDWNPHYLYRQLLPDAEAVDAFLTEIGFAEWNHAGDAGRPWAEIVEEVSRRHPHRRELVAAYPARFPETLGGAVPGSVELLRELAAGRTRLLALTNWSAETFPHARRAYDWLGLFEAVVVSGEEGVAKPDPRIFEVLARRHRLEPGRTTYVDDVERNVTAAAAAGFDAVHFVDADTLRAQLVARGLPLARSRAAQPPP